MNWEIDPNVAARLLLASLLGCLIGLEREVHGRPAGFRTHLLVSLGACLFVTSSIQIYGLYGYPGKATGIDPARIAAQVVAGIGFLGAGAIIREKASIRGLTTAACLWVAAAIGISCGIGMFGPAILVTFLALSSLLFLKRVEQMLKRDTYVRLKIWSEDLSGQKEKVEAIIAGSSMSAVGLVFEKDLKQSQVYFEFEMKARSGSPFPQLIDEISTIEGMRRVKID